MSDDLEFPDDLVQPNVPKSKNPFVNFYRNWKALPFIVKRTYYVGAFLSCILLFAMGVSFYPSGDSVVSGGSTLDSSKTKGKTSFDESTVLPADYADQLIKARTAQAEGSSFVKKEFGESKVSVISKRLEATQAELAKGLEIPKVINEPKEVTKVERVNKEKREAKSEVEPKESESSFTKLIDKIKGDEGNDEPASSFEFLLMDEDVQKQRAATYLSHLGELSKNSINNFGPTTSYTNAPETQAVGGDKAIGLPNTSDNSRDSDQVSQDHYSGDDFLPGKKFLARIDGLIQSDSSTPFVRLIPVDGPLSKGDDYALFLAKPEFVNGGFVIQTETITWKSETGKFKAVAVSPDRFSQTVLVDEVESRWWQRAGIIFSTGILDGFNALASRVGTNIIVEDSTVTSGVDIDSEALIVSGLGGIGEQAQDYTSDLIDEYQDNYKLFENKLVALMVIEKPELSWLPDVNNRLIY